MTKGKLFCFGQGYSANVLAGLLINKGWKVSGTKQNPDDKKVNNIELHTFRSGCPITDLKTILEGVTHILVSVPPEEEGDPVLALHRLNLLKSSSIEWVGYLSTTGVYGDTGGQEVDERSNCKPTNKRSKRRLEAERAWLNLYRDYQLPVHIFRLAGIYGPGRSAIESIRKGKSHRINTPGHVFSRIHVEDIANILVASIRNPNPGQIYNVCDNEPASGADVTSYACSLLGVKAPPLIELEDATLSPMAKSFYRDNRRINNSKIHSELKIKLKHPSYREGLKSILKK